jgi:tetratricopeptide (TPR) repeat protein
VLRSTILFLAALLGAFAAASGQRIKLPASLSELEARAQKDSDDAAAQYNVALGYWNDQRFKDADKALRRAVQIDPKFAPGYVGLYYLPFAERSSLWDDIERKEVPDDWKPRLEEADRFFRRAYMIDPLVDLHLGDAVRRRATAYLQWIQHIFGGGIRDWVEGEDLFYQAKYQDAYDRLQRVRGEANLERLPSGVLWLHGLAAAHLGKFPDAESDFETLLNRSLERERRDSLLYIPLRTNEYRCVLAFLRQRAGDPNAAIRLYREAVQSDVGLYMAHAQMATIYEANRMWEQALGERQNAVNANPDDPSLVLDLGMTQAKAGRWAESEKSLREAMEANPRDPRVPYYLGIVDQQLNKKDDARVAFTHFLAIAPSRYDRQVADAKQRLAALQ